MKYLEYTLNHVKVYDLRDAGGKSARYLEQASKQPQEGQSMRQEKGGREGLQVAYIVRP